MKISKFILALSLAIMATTSLHAHGGRRFEIVVIDNQLFAHGYNSGADDGAPAIRPYLNSIHGHWDNVGGSALASLPGFGVFTTASSVVGNGSAGILAGGNLVMTLNAAYVWAAPATSGAISLTPLGGSDPTITIAGGTGPAITSLSLGSLVIAENLPASGDDHIDLTYQIDSNPSGQIYVLEWTLSTDLGGIASSSPIYTILSPDPDPTGSGTPNPMIGLHHPSLYMESQLGVVPEPGSMTLLILGAGGLLFGRGRRRPESR